jgi:3-hydroxyisobutyrate dehydrogenase-like beta-hydroxyacid dehydrogenase
MMKNTIQRVGLIGLGLMGHGIGRNLLKNGFALTILGNVNRKPVESLVGLGAAEAIDLADLVRNSDAIILCVTGSPEVESIVYRENGLLENMRPEQVLIDCSTSEPQSSVKICADLARKGAIFVDAPLGRTPVEAEAGRLNSMVGATPEILEWIRPVLSAYSENIIHVGDVVSAQRLKLINNFAVVGTAALLTEALRICDQVGVPRQALHDVMSKGPLNSGMLQMTIGEILQGNFSGMKFSISNASKDITYFGNMIGDSAAGNSLSNDLQRTLAHAIGQGLGEKFLPDLVNSK